MNLLLLCCSWVLPSMVCGLPLLLFPSGANLPWTLSESSQETVSCVFPSFFFVINDTHHTKHGARGSSHPLPFFSSVRWFAVLSVRLAFCVPVTKVAHSPNKMSARPRCGRSTSIHPDGARWTQRRSQRRRRSGTRLHGSGPRYEGTQHSAHERRADRLRRIRRVPEQF